MAKKAKKKTVKKTVKKVTKKATKGKPKALKTKKATRSNQAKSAKKSITAKKTSAGQTKILGMTVPSISAPATGGKTLNLSQLRGKKVVLYFYPKDMTPGCTIEGHEFSKLKSSFAKNNTVVYGVSRDSVALHEKFKEKECYTIDLLSDTDEKLCKLFDVIKDKNMYGKKVRGIERSTFVINEQGKVEKEWRKVQAEGHAKEVLSYLAGSELAEEE